MWLGGLRTPAGRLIENCYLSFVMSSSIDNKHNSPQHDTMLFAASNLPSLPSYK